MDHLVSLQNVSLAFGLNPLLENVQLQIAEGERVCLIGRNGAGKSSLLKVIEGLQVPDSGHVWRKPHLRLATLAQELPYQLNATVFEYVATGLAETGQLLADYHALTHHESHDSNYFAELERLQQAIEVRQGWLFEQNIQSILTRLELDRERPLSDLSGGWQRRAALARALVATPELLLLDEPTNHLDIDAIQWLEDQLISSRTGLIFITHDRSLLKRLATRIIELDRGQLTSWPGDYNNFLRRKEEMLNAEAKLNSLFDKKLAQEEVWIRQGIKARRTRNEGRVHALEKMRGERAERVGLQGKVAFNLNEAVKSGKLVIEATGITQHFNQQCVINNFSLCIMRGDRIGLIGPNGSGKSTLLNILLGNLIPDKGIVKQGTNLQIAYFDQLRKALDLDKTVIDNIAKGCDFITINNSKRHVMSYLQDFLFTPARVLTPVKALSGGECNRLLLARLFSQPFNVLVMDEPTNDLDIETLELLEELINEYQGTLLLVSHDRTFLDNVVTSTLVFEGHGNITEYVGGYQDYLRQRKTPEKQAVKQAKIINKTEPSETSSKKLSYKEQKELAGLPVKIENLEKELAELQTLISTNEFYQQDPAAIAKTMGEIKTVESNLVSVYQRWTQLDNSTK